MSPGERAGQHDVRHGRLRDLLVLCAVVVLLMSAVSVANLSVPALAAGELHPSATEQTWFVDAFVIAFACLLLPAEMLGARYGEERLLVLGLVLFAVASLLALLAPGMPLLIASRGLAGIGAGLALPQTLSVLLRRSSGRRHAAVVAAWTASTSVAGLVGNGLGGLLIASGGWRSPFAWTLPLTVLLLATVMLVVGTRRPRDPHATLDLPGTALFVVAAVAALVTLIEAPNLVDRPLLLAVPAVVCGAAAVAFWRIERRASHPLLQLHVFRSPVVRAAALGIVATFAGLFTLFSLNAHLVQTVRGLNAAVAGLALVPVSVSMFVVTYATVPLVRRFGLSAVVAAGLMISAGGYALVAAGIQGPFWGYEAAVVVVGVGAGLCSSPLSTRLTMEYSATGGRAGAGVNSTLRELSSAAGVGVAGVALALTIPAGAGAQVEREAVTAAAAGTFWGVAALLVVCCGAMLVDVRTPRRR